MAELTFSQPARRNLLVPILLTLILVAAALYALLRFTPHRTAHLEVTHVSTYAAHTVFKSDTIVVGEQTSQDDLYVVATVRLGDDLHIPIFVDDITATLVPADTHPGGNEPLPTSAIQHPDFANLFTSFPAVKTLTDTAGTPLLRELQIAPGQTAEGYVILHFPVDQKTWDERKQARLTIALYHQQPQTVDIPKQPQPAAPAH